MTIQDVIGNLEWTVAVNANGDTEVTLMDAPNMITLGVTAWHDLLAVIESAIDFAQEHTEYDEQSREAADD